MVILMTKLLVRFQRLVLRENGQDLVEYALVICLLAIGCVAAMKTVSGDVMIIYEGIKNAIANAA